MSNFKLVFSSNKNKLTFNYLCLFRSPIIYSENLAHVQVIINSPYAVAQMCTHEDALAYILGAPFIDDIMSYNSLITLYFKCLFLSTSHKNAPSSLIYLLIQWSDLIWRDLNIFIRWHHSIALTATTNAAIQAFEIFFKVFHTSGCPNKKVGLGGLLLDPKR